MAGRLYLGVGLKYPNNVPNGKAELVDDLNLINQSIKIILDTPTGTRLFLPEFGSRLRELIFEPNDAVLFDLLEYFIIEALNAWEKRIKVVKVECDSDNETLVNCTIRYRILSSNEVESFVYPFYRKIRY